MFKKLKLSDQCIENSIIYGQINKICESINSMLTLDESKNSEDINICFLDLLKLYGQLKYSFQTANQELQFTDGLDESMNMILLCKNVRTMEDLINKICSNNIDKSIIGGEKHFDSMRHGFVWLFCHNDINKSPSYQRIDIRDRNRYLDYIKYQIMISENPVKHSPKTSEIIDIYYKKIQDAFDSIPFPVKVEYITSFKEAVTKLIDEFFSVYELLTKYRDALFQEEEIRKNVNTKVKPPKIPEKIVRLSSVAVRVLLDRFVSFVKINDLNFGNSTFNRSWFNYSELSNSNYAGSNFKNARIENAKVKNCDVSTSNLSLADGSGTDFSDSNFDYSNLTGINLDNATINNCQFHRALFRDSNLDVYKNAIDDCNITKNLKNTVSNKNISTEEKNKAKRILSLLDCWGASCLNFDCIDGIKEGFLKMPLPNINLFDSEPSVFILKSQGLDSSVAENMEDLIRILLGSNISSELLEYIKERFNKENPDNRNYRETKNGKVLLEAASLISVSAKNAQMKESDLCHVKMENASFENADLSASRMYYTRAKYVSFISSNLNDIKCFETDFYTSNFSNAVVTNSQFVNCTLNSTNWNKAIMIGTKFIDASECLIDIIVNKRCSKIKNQIEKCFQFDDDISTSVVKDQNKVIVLNEYCDNKYWQSDCGFNSATIMNALADNTEFINIVSSRSTFNNSSFKSAFFANCRMHLSDFISVDFRYAYFVCSSLSQSNFSNANMTLAKLHYVDFCDANLSNALMNMSDLNHVLFSSSNLSGLNLSGATIKNCAFKDCRFENVILAGTTFENCVFEDVRFLNLIGVHSCRFTKCRAFDCSDEEGNRIELQELTSKN